MRADYRALREQWGGFAGYDWWFEQPLNNAQIASVAMYTQLVPGFQKLLADSGGDLPRFYAGGQGAGEDAGEGTAGGAGCRRLVNSVFLAGKEIHRINRISQD